MQGLNPLVCIGAIWYALLALGRLCAMILSQARGLDRTRPPLLLRLLTSAQVSLSFDPCAYHALTSLDAGSKRELFPTDGPAPMDSLDDAAASSISTGQSSKSASKPFVLAYTTLDDVQSVCLASLPLCMIASRALPDHVMIAVARIFFESPPFISKRPL